MSEKARKPENANVNPVAEQIPHSGVTGHEQPVFNFNGQSLQEALDNGDLHIEYDAEGKAIIVPNSLGDHVDPTKSGRTEVYEPLSVPTTEKKRSRKGVAAMAAGAVATAVIGGLGAVKMFGGDEENSSPRSEPTATAPATPGGEQSTEAPKDIDNVNIRPTTEQLRLAETPVTAAEFPTVELAYAALKDRMNIYALGARMDFTSTPPVETPESLESKEKLADIIYGPNHETDPNFDLSIADRVRERVGLKLYYYHEIEKKEMTFRRNSEVTSIEKTTVPGTAQAYIVHSIESTESNLSKLDPMQTDFDAMIANPQQAETTVILAPNGNWYIDGVDNVTP